MAEIEEFAVEELSKEDIEKERQKLMDELIRTFLPDLGTDKAGLNFTQYYDECKEAVKKRIHAAIAEDNYTKAYLLSDLYTRVFVQNVLYEKGSGYNYVRVLFNRAEGKLTLETHDDRKHLTINKNTANQILQEFLYKAKEVVDPDDFLFI